MKRLFFVLKCSALDVWRGFVFFLYQLIILIDQAFNVLCNGYADETLQSRAYRAWRANKIFGKIFKPIIDLLFFFEKDHCRVSYLAEVYRRQLPPQFIRWLEKREDEV